MRFESDLKLDTIFSVNKFEKYFTGTILTLKNLALFTIKIVNFV